MLSNAEVLAELGNWLSPGDISRVLPGLLRIPEVWDQIHDQEFIQKLTGEQFEENLHPRYLVEVQIELSMKSGRTFSSMDELDATLEELVDHIESLPPDQIRFEQVAILSSYILSAAPSDHDVLLKRVHDNPAHWRSAIACSWSELGDRSEFTSALINSSQDEVLLLAINAVLANVDLQAAVQSLSVMTHGQLPRNLFPLISSREPELVTRLIEMTSSRDLSLPGSPQGEAFNSLLMEAYVARQNQEYESASKILKDARETSDRTYASISDQCAEIARSLGDLELELQAREDALRHAATPRRRAALAYILLRMERFSESQAVLDPEPTSLEELTILALINHHMGRPDRSREYCRSAADALQTNFLQDFSWTEILLDLLKKASDSGRALDLASLRCAVLGTRSANRVEFAQILLEAGNTISAAEQAHIAYALSPRSVEAREIVALALQASGQPAEALAHWNVLSETDNKAILRVAQCAIEAGYIDLAMHTAESLLTNDLYAPEAQLIIGAVYRLEGDIEAAIAHFEEVTQETPDHIDAWIALAECFQSVGDREACGHTLSTAIQMNPSNARLRHAQALWLEGEGRLSDALETVEGAYDHAPKNFEILVTFGDLLRRLGHRDRAEEILTKAVVLKPAHWRGLHALAQIQGESGKWDQALRTISELPPGADPQAVATAGELTIRAASHSQDAVLASKGIEQLSMASENGVESPRYHHYLGMAYETTEEYEGALQAYQNSLRSLSEDDYQLRLDSKVGLGRAALALGQTDLAITMLEQAQNSDPNSIPLSIVLSKAYLRSHKVAKAFEAAELALRQDPTDRAAIDQISQVATETDNWEIAMGAMKRLVELKPLDPASWITYAKSSSQAKSIPETRMALAQALSHGRHDPKVLIQAARVMNGLGLYQSARRCLSLAISKKPDDVDIFRDLAHTAELTGDKNIAQRAWSRCVELDPSNVSTLERAAAAHWALGLRTSAMDYWGKAIQIESQAVYLYLRMASAHFAQGDSAKGLEQLSDALRLNAGDIDSALECCQLAIDAGEPAFALSNLEGLLSKAPTRNDLLLTMAEAYLALERNTDANGILQSIILETDPPDGWFAVSSICAHQDKHLERAKKYFQMGLERPGLSARERILLAQAALSLGHWKEALDLVEQTPPDPTSWQELLASANVHLRIHEVDGIFKIANVDRYSPSNLLAEPQEECPIEGLVDAATLNLAPKHHIEVAKIRRALTSNRLIDTNLWNDALLILQARPSVIVLEALVIASLRTGRFQEALETIALRDDLRLESEWLDLFAGIAQHSLGHFPASQKSFQRAEEDETLRPLARYLSAKTLITLEDRDSAIEQMKSALGIWPKEATWQYQLGNLLRLNGDLDLALPHLQEAHELHPDNPIYRNAFAKALKLSGHLSQAYEYYRQAVEHDPNDGSLSLEAGQLALGMGDLLAAEGYFQKACELLPSNALALSGAAKVALSSGKVKAAIKLVRRAMELAPDEPEVLVTLGEILTQQGKLEKALQSYDLAIPKVKDPNPLRIARVHLLIKMKAVSQALEEMSAMTGLYPENEEIWANYAEVCEVTDNLAAGIEAANRASKLAPHNPKYRLLLARLCRKSGQLDRALDELSKLEANNPSDVNVLIELGMLYESRRQYSEALEAYQRAIAANANSSLPYLRAGVVLKHLKIYPQAGEMLRKAVELDSQDHEALHQLAAVRALELVHGGIREMAVTT